MSLSKQKKTFDKTFNSQLTHLQYYSDTMRI